MAGQTFEDILTAELTLAQRTLRQVELRARRNKGMFAQQPGGRVKRVSGRFGGDKKPSWMKADSGDWEWDLSAAKCRNRHADPIPPIDEALAEAKGFGQDAYMAGHLLAAYCDGSRVVLTEATPFGVRRLVIKTEPRFTAVA